MDIETRARARPPSGVAHNSAKNLAERWFRPKKFETDGRLYRWLGVIAFKRLLMRVVRKSPAKPNTVNSHVLGGRSLRHVREFEIKSRRSELIHLVGLAIGILCLGLRAIDDRLITAAIIAFALNFPCFALQRFNRARIYRYCNVHRPTVIFSWRANAEFAVSLALRWPRIYPHEPQVLTYRAPQAVGLRQPIYEIASSRVVAIDSAEGRSPDGRFPGPIALATVKGP